MMTSEQIEQERQAYRKWITTQSSFTPPEDIKTDEELLEALFETWLARAGQAVADTARLDWLADPDNHIGAVQLPSHCVETNIHSLRDAIDCAMELSNTETDSHPNKEPS